MLNHIAVIKCKGQIINDLGGGLSKAWFGTVTMHEIYIFINEKYSISRNHYSLNQPPLVRRIIIGMEFAQAYIKPRAIHAQFAFVFAGAEPGEGA